jgi:glycoprotease/Kae1 family metallohydrolase
MSIKCFLKRNLLKKEFTYFKHRQNLSTRSTVLGIETSCDDTAVGVVTSDRKILAESKYNQWSKHSKLGMSKKDSQWSGGVVPDLAKKLHSVNLIHAVSDCIEKLPNGWSDIDAIALTTRPGLEICLWEGINFTRLLLNKYRLPLIPINHMEAHALTSRLFDPSLKYPFLTLLISGGHCLLVLAEEYDRFYQLGSSIDSSPGIYLDKVARSLGLFEIESANQDNGNDQTYGLSGGALVEKYAAKNGIVNEKRFNSFINSVKAYCGKNLAYIIPIFSFETKPVDFILTNMKFKNKIQFSDRYDLKHFPN